MECMLVVDFGTSNARTNLVDIDTGRIVQGKSKPVNYFSPQKDYHEIDVNDYWLASVETLGYVINNIPDKCKILGLIFSYIGDSLVPVDKDGNPVYNMLASYDLRARNDMELYTHVLGEKRFEEISGCPLTPRNTGAKIYWLKKHMPERMEQAAMYLTLQQYINMKLGLGPVSDYSVANRKLMLDVRKKKWSEELMRLINTDLDEMGAVIVSGDECIGKIRRYGSVELPYEVPVFPGGHDSAVGFIGLGLDMYTEGILGNVGGTFDHYGYLTKDYEHTIETAGIQTVAGPIGESYVTIKAHPAGKDLLWFVNELTRENDTGVLNRYFSKSTFDGTNQSYYTTGLDTGAGCFVYLKNTSGPQQIFDTLIEGMTFLSKDYVELFKKLPRRFSVIRIGGGSGKSRVWPALKANIFGCPVETVSNLEVSSVGAAAAGAVGLGIYSYKEAFDKMVAVSEIFEPDEEISRRYQENYLRWKEICSSISCS